MSDLDEDVVLSKLAYRARLYRRILLCVAFKLVKWHFLPSSQETDT